MATVAFDFDSTLIARESLDELLARRLADDPARVAEVRAISDAGMEGRLSFPDSLARRLAIARPTRVEVAALGREALGWITPGMDTCVAGLEADVWVVSGGLREVLLPVAARLGVPPERVAGTRARWDSDGTLAAVEPSRDKVEQLEALGAAGWTRPRIMVGDGMTDYEPSRAGLVDHFIAFTENVRRPAVVATGAPEARSVRELEYLLDRLL